MIPHNIGLLKERIAEISIQLKAEDTSFHVARKFFSNRGIEIFDKLSHWILRRVPGAETNPWNSLTNGLVIPRLNPSGKKDVTSIWSFPFTKFFVPGELFAPEFGMGTLVEKIQGTPICVCFPSRVWAFNDKPNPVFCHTLQMSGNSIDESNPETTTLAEARKLIESIEFGAQDIGSTFMFEYIRPGSDWYADNRVGLHLVGARQMSNFDEYSERELDDVAKRFRVGRPEIWYDLRTWKDMASILHKDKYPGYIVRFDDGRRLKLEKASILYKNSKKLTYKKLIPMWLDGQRHHVQKSNPESAALFDELEKTIDKTVIWLADTISKLRVIHTLPRRDQMEAIRKASIAKWAHRFVMRGIHEDPVEVPAMMRNELLRMSPGVLKSTLELKG